MKELNRFLVLKTIWMVLEAALLIALGIVIISNYQTAPAAIGIVTGILITIDAALHLSLYFLDVEAQKEKSGLFVGVVELALGIFVCMHSDLVTEFITLLVVLLVLITGVVLITDGVTKQLRRKEYPTPLKFIILEYVGGGILLAAGVAGLILLNVEIEGIKLQDILLIVIGSLLILGGVAEITYSIGMLVFVSKAKTVIKEEIKKSEEKEDTSVTVVKATDVEVKPVEEKKIEEVEEKTEEKVEEEKPEEDAKEAE